MEFEQLIKRLDWLEAQQRKTSEAISNNTDRLANLERDVAALGKSLRAADKELAELHILTNRVNQFEEMFTKQRKELNTAVDGIDKSAQKRETEITKRQQVEWEKLARTIEELRRETDTSEIRKTLKDKVAEEIRISQALADMKARAEEIASTHEKLMRAQQTLEENRRTDNKRLAEVQGDVSAIRKRLDEVRDKNQLTSDSQRIVENRITELLASETERKQNQVTFIEQQTLAQVDRERAWKDWNDRVESFKKQVASLDTQIQTAEEASRTAKRAQDTYAELNQKLERRINEITEMQRLTDERSRQEWVTFKADDQKRWTSYTLSQDESIRELRQSMSDAAKQISGLDELVQTAQDQLHQTTDATERQMQELMNRAHEWLTASERIMGHARKTTSKPSKPSKASK